MRAASPRSIASSIGRYQVARANVLPGVAPTAVAADTAAPSARAAFAPDTAGTDRGLCGRGRAASPTAGRRTEPMFHSLFQQRRRRGAGRAGRRPTVDRAASAPTAPSADSAADRDRRRRSAPARPPAPLDLFQDQRPDARGLFSGNGC